MEAKTGVFIVSKNKGSIKQVAAPKVVKRGKTERSYLFYGKENGQGVWIPGPSMARIKIKDLFRGRRYDEPMNWKNDYEVVVTEIGYVLVGFDVRRGIATGLQEYPVYWYDSLASAKEDYQISSVSLMPGKEDKDGSTIERIRRRNFEDADRIIEALLANERDVIVTEVGHRSKGV